MPVCAPDMIRLETGCGVLPMPFPLSRKMSAIPIIGL